MPLNLKKVSKPTATIDTKIVDSKTKQEVSHSTVQETPELGTKTNDGSDTTPWCSVGFEAGYTHGLPNYSSARIGISLTIPCKPGEIDQVYEVAKAWVDERLQVCVNELSGASGE